MFEGKEMRAVLADFFKEAMAKDERLMILDADLAKANGTSALQAIYPERAIDIGIAEQNMCSIAAGLSSYGFISFIGTFTPFATRRICDQIAISVCYAKQNVKIIGSDPGISAEFNGGTHMSVEDIGVLRSIPDIVIFEPVDGVQLYKALPKIIEYYGPVYIRMFRKTQPIVFKDDYEFDLFKADVIEEGIDVSIFASGIMVEEAVLAVKLLKEKRIFAELINVHTIKPLDKETILKSVKKTNAVVVAENHNIIGGLGSAVCELLSAEYPIFVERIGIPDRFGEVGKMPYLKKIMRMTAADIVDACLKAITRKSEKR